MAAMSNRRQNPANTGNMMRRRENLRETASQSTAVSAMRLRPKRIQFGHGQRWAGIMEPSWAYLLLGAGTARAAGAYWRRGTAAHRNMQRLFCFLVNCAGAGQCPNHQHGHGNDSGSFPEHYFSPDQEKS